MTTPQQTPTDRATTYLQDCYTEWKEARIGLDAIKRALPVAQLRYDFAQLNLNEASAEWLDEYRTANEPEPYQIFDPYDETVDA